MTTFITVYFIGLSFIGVLIDEISSGEQLIIVLLALIFQQLSLLA